jgi:hypothetical protein
LFCVLYFALCLVLFRVLYYALNCFVFCIALCFIRFCLVFQIYLNLPATL